MNSTPDPERLPGRASDHLALRCQARSIAGRLEITYSATNGASDDAYLLDLSATPHPDHNDFDVEVRPIYVAWLGGTAAHLGQGIAPLPPDRDMNHRVIPFATRLVAGASITRTITLPSPLVELGPYDAPARPAPGAPTIDRLIVTLSAMRPAAPGFEREELPRHPGVFRVASKYTVGDVERARCEISIPPTELLIFRWDVSHLPTFVRAE